VTGALGQENHVLDGMDSPATVFCQEDFRWHEGLCSYLIHSVSALRPSERTYKYEEELCLILGPLLSSVADWIV
jgi:hypothetical protein